MEYRFGTPMLIDPPFLRTSLDCEASSQRKFASNNIMPKVDKASSAIMTTVTPMNFTVQILPTSLNTCSDPWVRLEKQSR